MPQQLRFHTKCTKKTQRFDNRRLKYNIFFYFCKEFDASEILQWNGPQTGHKSSGSMELFNQRHLIFMGQQAGQILVSVTYWKPQV